MISDAIVTLKKRNGSSQYAIGKFIQDKHKDHLPANFKKMLLIQLKNLVASHKLVKVKASFKLPSAAKTVAAAKPKRGAAMAKKKPTAPAKTKAAPKAKPAVPKATKLAAKLPRTSTRWTLGKKAPDKVAPKTSGRLITLEEIIKHFGEPMEEAAGILRGKYLLLVMSKGGTFIPSYPQINRRGL